MAVLAQATQSFVPVKEIREGVVILKDNSYRVVLMASTLNFALKSNDEQEAIVMQYQNFLNSLDFTVQFFIQSRKLNINPYLMTLEEARLKQTNDLMKIQIYEYTQFIRSFVATTNIVDKSFYVVVPYSQAVLNTTKSGGPLSILASFFGKKSAEQNNAEDDARFAEAKLQITQRADIVAQGLSSAGIRTQQLGTEELIELYYKLFNPGELEKESLRDISPRA